MPDIDWLFAVNLDPLIDRQALTSFSNYSDAFNVFHSQSERALGADLSSSFLRSRFAEVRGRNYERELNKPERERRTIHDALGSVDKFISLIFNIPKVRLGTLPDPADINSVYQLNFCGFWPFC